jgi:hypothetical protein
MSARQAHGIFEEHQRLAGGAMKGLHIFQLWALGETLYSNAGEGYVTQRIRDVRAYPDGSLSFSYNAYGATPASERLDVAHQTIVDEKCSAAQLGRWNNGP